MADTILATTHGETRILTVQMEDRPVNVVTPEFRDELAARVGEVLADPALSGAVITSGKRSFIAGADLKDFDAFSGAGTRDARRIRETISPFGRILRRIETGGKYFVAALPGTALGGGLEIALACHARIAAANAKASLGLPEVKLGLLPGAGGTQRLPRLIGLARALPLLLDGASLSVAEAHALGILDQVVLPHELLPAALAWLAVGHPPVQPWDRPGWVFPGPAGHIDPAATAIFQTASARAEMDYGCNSPARRAILRCVYEGHQLAIDHGLHIELGYFSELAASEEAHAIVRTMFIGRKALQKSLRETAGQIVKPIASVCLLAPPPRFEALRALFEARGVRVIDQPDAADITLAWPTCGRYSYIGGFDTERCIPVGDSDETPGIGKIVLVAPLGFQETELLEIVAGPDAPPQLCSGLVVLMTTLGKLCLLRGNGMRSIGAQIKRSLLREKQAILNDGLAATLTENCIRQLGFAQGSAGVAAANGPPDPAPAAVNERVPGDRPEPSAGDAYLLRFDHCATVSAEAALLKNRLMLRLLRDAVALVQEEVEHSPSPISALQFDLAAVMGGGFPRNAGGPLSVIDAHGAQTIARACLHFADVYGARFLPSRLLREMASQQSKFHATHL